MHSQTGPSGRACHHSIVKGCARHTLRQPRSSDDEGMQPRQQATMYWTSSLT
eukprot:m.217606 g.217606  ORF g.217606 m.217606 type:complete len:52 (-) comp33238_c1_seq1:133-288(-)